MYTTLHIMYRLAFNHDRCAYCPTVEPSRVTVLIFVKDLPCKIESRNIYINWSAYQTLGTDAIKRVLG